MQAEVERLKAAYNTDQDQLRADIMATIPMQPDYMNYTGLLAAPLAQLQGEFEDPELISALQRAFRQVAEGGMAAGTASSMLLPYLESGENNGEMTPAQLATANKLFEDAERLGRDLREDERDYANKFSQASTKLAALGSEFDEETGRFVHNIPQFDEQAAMRQFYSDQGVPNMGYMPSPSERFVPEFEPVRGLDDYREELERGLMDLPEVSPYSFGGDADERFNAAVRARKLQQDHINRALNVRRQNRERDSKEMGEFLASLGLTPYNASLQSMLNFSVNDALN